MLGASPDSPDNSLACGRNSPAEEEDERPGSRLSFTKAKGEDLKADFSRLSLLSYGNGSKSSTFDAACGGCDGDDEKVSKDILVLAPRFNHFINIELKNFFPQMEESCDTDDMWMTTMSARYMCEKGECSVQSCLNQFTAPELLTSNNKVGCELCTKRHGGPEKKTVYTNARKQLLIYNPPAVLILHLKRFQVLRFRSTKVSKPVSFQTLLDLAPFCSKKSRSLPTFETGQEKVLYSLYGVVEHSGSIHGGHYVAFVKVRPPLEKDSYRWGFLPKNQSKDKMSGVEPEEPPGKWYYVSDSFVSEVPESKVLNAQAYLLFYERVL